jgi:1-acyl-sn-glycerol-3-phosphate acyltransferase
MMKRAGALSPTGPAAGPHLPLTSDIPRPWPLLVRAFLRYTRYYLRRHFHTVRVAQEDYPEPPPPECPVVVFLNHPSWWDPLVALYLAFHCFPGRTPYAPIEARALQQYRFFSRLGFFGIEPGTRRGAATFLRVGQAILARPATALWLTPGGEFSDPRVRPVMLRSGLGHLARRLPGGVLFPLALEYPFWQERTPEALARFGAPIVIPRDGERSPEEWTALLARRLEATQDAMARDACRRNDAAFTILLRGASGVGGAYDLWRRVRARLHRTNFHPEHGVPE